jgi:hypothetical protein
MSMLKISSLTKSSIAIPIVTRFQTRMLHIYHGQNRSVMYVDQRKHSLRPNLPSCTILIIKSTPSSFLVG